MRSFVRLVAVLAVGALAAAGCSRTAADPASDAAAAPSPAPAGSASAAGSGKSFGAFCIDDAECAGAVCFHKRLKTPGALPERRGAAEAVEHDGFCSMRCDSDTDCPSPPTHGKCGARGMCK